MISINELTRGGISLYSLESHVHGKGVCGPRAIGRLPVQMPVGNVCRPQDGLIRPRKPSGIPSEKAHIPIGVPRDRLGR